MSFIKSKVFGALIVFNLIIFGALYQHSRDGGDEPSLATSPPPAGPDVSGQTDVATLETLSRSNKPVQQEAPKEEELPDELAAMFETALADLGSIDENDSAYVDALNGAASIQVKHADHLNKVDLSALSVKAARQPGASLEDQLSSMARNLVGDIASKSEKTYISALDREAQVRRNEVRLIKVVAGDTLWKIAQRAYGNGNLYQKIYKANPHIRNPDMIEVGEMLRVPL